ncbi:MAG: hypothetical protein V1678_03115 [Candidatus Aenigmatarchaeota archaeon]
MEIQTTFATIIGFLMMVIVVIAASVMLGGLTQISVEECRPSQYTASSSFAGMVCGFVGSQQVKCDIGTEEYQYDTCIDNTQTLCCPTTKKNIKVINAKCCNITKI